MIPASWQRNYLQSALYVIIAGVLAAVLLERLLTYAEAAEKAAMEVTLSQLHSGLYARLAFLALRGEYEAADLLATQSPVLGARMSVQSYRGEFDGTPPNLEGGQWYFDQRRHELVYLPKHRRYLSSSTEDGAAPMLRFRVEVLKISKYSYRGVTLRPVEPVQWQPF